MADYREDGRFIKEDGDVKKLRNDPHNPKNLLKRKREGSDRQGFNQTSKGWKPTPWNDTSAGKGDTQRESGIPKELYDLNWDLAFGKITKEEHAKKLKEMGY